mgnify:FL=1
MVHFSDPALNANKDSLGNANIIQHDEFDFFCEKRDSGYYVLGLLTDPETLPADDPFETFDTAINFMPVPLTLNDKINTGGKVRLTLEDQFISINLWIELLREMDVVNYGSVKMPDNMTYNVIVVDLFEQREDSTKTIFNGDTTYSSNVTREYYYEFYAKEYGMPLLRAQRDSVTDTIISIDFIDLNANPVGFRAPREYSLEVFPNPSNGDFTVKLPSESRKLVVVNAVGQVVEQNPVSGEGQYLINGLRDGVYFVQIFDASGNRISTAKLISN